MLLNKGIKIKVKKQLKTKKIYEIKHLSLLLNMMFCVSNILPITKKELNHINIVHIFAESIRDSSANIYLAG